MINRTFWCSDNWFVYTDVTDKYDVAFSFFAYFNFVWKIEPVEIAVYCNCVCVCVRVTQNQPDICSAVPWYNYCKQMRRKAGRLYVITHFIQNTSADVKLQHMAPVFIMLGPSITNKYRQKYCFNDALSDLYIQRNVRMSDDTFLWYCSGKKKLWRRH